MMGMGMGVALDLIVEVLNIGGGEVKKLIKDARGEVELEPSSLLPVKLQHLIYRLGIDFAQGGHCLIESIRRLYGDFRPSVPP